MTLSNKLWLGTAIFALSLSAQSGQTGQSGQSGQSGQTGQPGQSGQTGTPGTSGQSGTRGQSGQSGQRGTSSSDTTGQSGQSGAAGQMGASGQSGANRTGSSADNSFVMKAAMGGMAEVELGRLAETQASSDAVKQFGRRMVEDHSKANDELSQIATRKGITLPTSLDAKHQATKDRLSKLNGAAFDKAYMDDMVKDHHTDVADFRKESTSGQDSDVKAFAAKTLPTLEEHMRLAEQTQSSTKSSSGKSGSSSDASTSGTSKKQ